MIRYSHSFILSFAFLFVTAFAFAQGKFEFRGTVIESESASPLPFVTVVVQSLTSDKILVGTTTNEDGTFQIATDSANVYLKFSFIGFDKRELRDFNLAPGVNDLGEITLNQLSQTMGEVKVTAEKSSMEFKLDKRVFNVGSDISATGMGAMEVLNNVPSVSVDIEGNVKLRGNSGVQLLINGKPSVLSDDPSKALGTITADMIESIEVITNPSAKYDASGTSGIINIVLKKDENKGINGSISVNTGWPHNHSIGGSLNYRTKKFNLFTQFGAGYRSLPDYGKNENRNLLDTTAVISEGTAYRNENFYNITLGTDYYINKYNTLTLSGNFSYEVESQPSETAIYFIDATGTESSRYNRTEVTSALNPKYQYDLKYAKQFKNNKDHKLEMSAIGRYFGKDQSSTFTNNYTLGSATIANQRTNTRFFQQDQTYQIDYTNPLSTHFTLESGAMYNLNNVGNDYQVYNEENGAVILDSSLTNNFEYNQKVLGVYATGGYERTKWGLKLGLRVENTDLQTVLTNTNEVNNQNYTNLFPTVHTSYKISKKVQLQSGYSKRIFRPRLWDLNPFFNIRNNFNIRTGNPDLLPEFGDSYELTGIFLFNKVSLNTSLYYLFTTNVKETISIYANGVTTTTPMNIGTNQKLGLELNWKYTPVKWFSLMGDANYGYFNRQGEYDTQNFDFSGDQWSGRLNFKFKFKSDIDLEFTTNYESKYKTVQGVVSGFAFADAGIRKKIGKGKAVVNLSVRDIFASRIRESVISQPNYFLYDLSQRGRFVTLGFSYSFGKGEAMSYTGGGRH